MAIQVKLAGKPGSVVDSHSSGMPVTGHLKQPTRKHARAVRRKTDESACPFPYLALLLVGFTWHPASPPDPVSSYLTFSP